MIRRLAFLFVAIFIVIAALQWFKSSSGDPRAVADRFVAYAQTGNVQKAYNLLSPSAMQGHQAEWRQQIASLKTSGQPPKYERGSVLNDTFNTYKTTASPYQYSYIFYLADSKKRAILIVVNVAGKWRIDHLRITDSK